ncbi:DNA polymerase IV [Planctomycetota bacterium]
MILHLDIDAFFASVEQIRNPVLRGTPVIVGSGVIASCSYEARRYGLCAAMSIGKAKRLCPGVVVLPGDSHVYASFAEKVWDVCSRFTPDMETFLDDAYLELSGSEKLRGSPEGIARSIKDAVGARSGLSVTMGIATSRVIARMASAGGKPNGLTMVSAGEEPDFVRALPISDLPGIGRATAGILRKVNVTTIGELAALPPRSLLDLLGQNGLMLHERANGRDSMVLHKREIPRSISRETTFRKDMIDPAEIEATLYYLTERAMNTMRSLGLTTHTVAVKIRYSDHETDQTSTTLPRHTDFDAEVFETARELLQRLHTRRVSLHAVGIALSRFVMSKTREQHLFDPIQRKKLHRLYEALDDLRDRYGYAAVISGKSIELLKHLPRNSHGFVLRTPSLTK